jgi:hypothetical protein
MLMKDIKCALKYYVLRYVLKTNIKKFKSRIVVMKNTTI